MCPRSYALCDKVRVCVHVCAIVRGVVCFVFRVPPQATQAEKKTLSHISLKLVQTFIAAQYVRMRTHIQIPAYVHFSKWVTDFF